MKFPIAATLVIAASQAGAQACGDRGALTAEIATKYGESLVAGGVQKSRGSLTVMEIWASSETGTFTVLLTQPNGMSCVVAAGTDFFKASITPEGDPT